MLSLISCIGLPLPYRLLLSRASEKGLKASSVILSNFKVKPSSVNLALSAAVTNSPDLSYLKGLLLNISSRVKPESLPVLVNCLSKYFGFSKPLNKVLFNASFFLLNSFKPSSLDQYFSIFGASSSKFLFIVSAASIPNLWLAASPLRMASVASKVSVPFFPRLLKLANKLFQYFSIGSFIALPVSAGPFLNLWNPVPARPKAPVKAPPSKPNFNLLANSFAAASLLVSLFSLSNAVGPPNKSPNVPAFSTSPTNAASATPPKPAPPAYSNILPFLVRAKSCTALLIGATLKVVAFGIPFDITSSANPLPVNVK